MKGVAGAILAATPLAAIVLYFALSGNQQVRVDQQRIETSSASPRKAFRDDSRTQPLTKSTLLKQGGINARL